MRDISRPPDEIIHGDAREVLAAFPSSSISAIVTDPPYGLEFLGVEWDKLARPKPGHIGGFANGTRPSFERVRRHLPLLAAWHESWARAALHALKPGGYLLAMGATRTWHYLASGLEAAGFEIRDCLSWIYATGFPKSVDLARAVARMTGEYSIRGTESLVDFRKAQIHTPRRPAQLYERPRLFPCGSASRWNGWGTALKPAWEPIVVARKPLGERTLLKNVLVHGTGGFNIGGCRIPFLTEPIVRNNWYKKDRYDSARRSLFQGTEHAVRRGPDTGRFPANVLCDKVPDAGPLQGVIVAGQGISNTAARGDPIFRKTPKVARIYGAYGMRGVDYAGNPPEQGLGDGILGPYTRFFRLPVEDPESDRFFVVPKPSKGERGMANRHPTVKPVRLFRHLIRLVTPTDGIVCDPFLGSGTTAVAAVHERRHFIGIEKRADYVRLARSRVREALRDATSSNAG